MALPFAQPIVCPQLIGRAAPLDLLAQLIERTCGGAGGIALVSGEAGIGKSRLVGEARDRAVDRGWTVAQGNCFELDRSLPYAPVADLLRSLASEWPDDELVRRWGSVAPELVKLAPEIAVRLPGLAPNPPLEPEQEKRRLFEAVAQALGALAAEGPALLCVEDLHWADDASLDLLLFAARRLARRPVLLVLTYRSDEVGPRLAHTLAALDRERLAAEASLDRLTDGEIEAMLRAIFNLQRPARPEFVAAIHELTDGNPFFVEEALRSLIAAGDIFYADGEWDRKPMADLRIPRSVHDAVQQRAARLSPAAREALALAAVAGRRFDLDLLARLTGRDERALLALMKEMVAAGLVVEEAAGRFAFRHALTRQAIEADLLLTERAALHRAIAEALERAQAESSASRAPDLAHHFYAAGAWEPAGAYARQAGDQALAMYAPREAVRHYAIALEAARRLGQPPDPAVLRSRALAHDHLGEFESARADHEAALQAAGVAGDRMAEWQALIDLGFLWSSRDYARAGDYFQRALALARDLGDPARLGHSLNRVGNWHLNVEQAPEALLHHEQALAIFERLDDRPGIAATLDLLGLTTASCTDAPRGAAHYERSIALFRDLGDRRGESNALAMLAVLNGASYLATGVAAGSEASTAALEGESALQVARAIGWRDGEAFALFELSLAFGWRGDYGRALPAARQALSVAEEIEHRQWIVGANAALGGLHLDLLALPLALRHLERALPLARAIGSGNWVRLITAFLAATHLARGDAARAEAVLADELAPEALAHSIGQRLCWLTRARLALARGEPDRALSIADRLLATAAHVETRGERGIPALALLRGEALAALRQFDEAQAALQAAHDGAREQGIRSLLWRIEIVLGNLHQAQRRSADAERAFAAARAMVDELADTVPDEALRDNFRREAANLLPRSRPLTPLRAAKEAAGGLTAREREVAALVARGRSNREIAEELSVGEVTVATHVSNILGKLDLTSRAQIAAWAVERGLGSAR